VPLLTLGAVGTRKLPTTAAQDLLEPIMRCYERASTVLTYRTVDDWERGKSLREGRRGTPQSACARHRNATTRSNGWHTRSFANS
jgi:hypothetical protein